MTINQHPSSPFERAAAFSIAVNSAIERAMPFLPPIGVLAGFLASPQLSVMKPAVPWFFALMTLSGALKLRVKQLGEVVSRPTPVLIFLLGSHILMPLVAYGTSVVLFPDNPDLIAGYVLLFATPTAVTAFIWVSIFQGNGALTLAVILLDSLLAPVLVPQTVSILLGTRVAINGGAIMGSLFAMVVAPTILGVFLNEISGGKLPERINLFLSPFSKFCVLLVIAGNSAAVAPSVDFSSPTVLTAIALCVALAVIGFSLGNVLGSLPGIDGETKRSLTFTVGFRNTSAASTIAIAFFPQTAALPATLGVIFQQTLAAIMGRVLLGRPGNTTKMEKPKDGAGLS